MRFNALKKLKNSKSILIVVLVMASFFVAPQTMASWQETVVGGIFFLLIGGLGLILSLVIKVLLMVASYQNFIGSQAVIQGWVIVRDLANMFFVVILLVIAFATILHIENYNYKKWLPKLILMAVLINFSKTICGLLIDVAQIVMLTFVNAFKDIAAGNFVDMMGIKEIVTFQKETEGNVFWTLMGSYILGLIFMIVATVVLTTMLMVLVMRMVMIWIYVVLSPLAYLLSAFPGGASYASKWWKDFISNLIVGPVLAFFIWLAFAALQTSESVKDLDAFGESRLKDGIVVTGAGQERLDTADGNMLTEASKPSVFIKFIIGIGMLIGGLKIAQEIGGAAGSIAGKGVSKLNTMGAATVGGIGGFALGRSQWAGRKLDQAQMWAQQGIAKKTGNTSYVPKSLNPNMIKAGWKRSSDEQKSKYYDLHGGLENAWHDSFNKFTDIRQYGSIRKGRNRLSADRNKADTLRNQNKQEETDIETLEKRKSYVGLSGKKYSAARNNLVDNKDAIIADYVSKDKRNVDPGEKMIFAQHNYDEDMKALESVTDDDQIKDSLDHQINIRKAIVNARDKKIDDLEDVRLSMVGAKLGFSSSHIYDPVYSASGNKEALEKEQKNVRSRTEGDSFALVTELLKAFKENNTTRAAASLKELAKNNDLNEALKDDRVLKIMNANNGILEKLARKGSFGDKGLANIDNIKKDFSANRVSPAYVQALIQGVFEKTGASSDLAGRYANDIGLTSFSSGNGLAYGIANGDAASGQYKFSELNYDENENGLRTSESRKMEVVGKFNTMESQSKMRAIHPNTIIVETKDGSANGLNDVGKEFLKNLNSHDLGQISRLRSDLVKKFGDSKKTMQDAIKLVQELEADGQHEQASNVKYFVGYVQSKKSSAGAKDVSQIKAAYDEAVSG